MVRGRGRKKRGMSNQREGGRESVRETDVMEREEVKVGKGRKGKVQ